MQPTYRLFDNNAIFLNSNFSVFESLHYLLIIVILNSLAKESNEYTITTSIELETVVDPNIDTDGDGFKDDVDPDPDKFTYAD